MEDTPEEFDFELKHVKGIENTAADILSRIIPITNNNLQNKGTQTKLQILQKSTHPLKSTYDKDFFKNLINWKELSTEQKHNK